MDKYELYAIGHYLNDWPEEMSYKQIISEMANGDEGNNITECEVYEGIPLEDLAVIIDDMTESLRMTFK